MQSGRQAWEGMYKRSWDMVQEDEGGGLQAAVDSLIARGRRKRCVIIFLRHLSSRDAAVNRDLRGGEEVRRVPGQEPSSRRKEPLFGLEWERH